MTSLRIGIIGVGNMGGIHARILGNLRQLVAIADTDLDRANEVASKHGVEAFESYETMIESASINCVIISTPTSTHAKIAEEIARKYEGIKGILIEKPIASSYKDAKRVAKVLRDKGISTVVSHSEIYNPVVDRALNLIKTGAIGTPQTIIHDRRGFVQPTRIPSLGDVFEDIGVHDFDIMARISNGPAKLYAQCNESGDVFNDCSMIVKFESGTQHIFHLSRQYAGRKRTMDVSGTKGTLVLDLFAQIIKVTDLDQEPSADGRTLRLPERGATIKVYGEPLGEVINDFLICIETGATPKVGLDDGIAALEVVEAARRSAKTGRVVDLDIKPRG